MLQMCRKLPFWTNTTVDTSATTDMYKNKFKMADKAREC